LERNFCKIRFEKQTNMNEINNNQPNKQINEIISQINKQINKTKTNKTT